MADYLVPPYETKDITDMLIYLAIARGTRSSYIATYDKQKHQTTPHQARSNTEMIQQKYTMTLDDTESCLSACILCNEVEYSNTAITASRVLVAEFKGGYGLCWSSRLSAWLRQRC